MAANGTLGEAAEQTLNIKTSLYDEAPEQAPDPEEADITTSLQALNTKENNEVSGRTSSEVTSRKAKEIRKQVHYLIPPQLLMIMIIIAYISR